MQEEIAELAGDGSLLAFVRMGHEVTNLPDHC
jgi:hypothetical protein